MAVNWKGAEIAARIRREVMVAVVNGAEGVLAEGNSLIQSPPKTGRIYRRRGVSHQASAPGEPPASDTGRLVNSGRTEFDVPKLLGRVIWSTDYAEPLEYGTQKMEPRPYARVALANKLESIIASVRAAVSRAVS